MRGRLQRAIARGKTLPIRSAFSASPFRETLRDLRRSLWRSPWSRSRAVAFAALAPRFATATFRSLHSRKCLSPAYFCMPVFECVICTAVQRKRQSLKKGGVAPPYTGFALFRPDTLDVGLSVAFFRTMTCMDAHFKTACQASDPLILVLHFRAEIGPFFLQTLHRCSSRGEKVVFDPPCFLHPGVAFVALAASPLTPVQRCRRHPHTRENPALASGVCGDIKRDGCTSSRRVAVHT